ncbi:MAG: hypothetical protein J7577_07000 [Sphingobacteriaceae bacterium]|nr:hypothetical protein [Sphingobacteriaceae bacterium]
MQKLKQTLLFALLIITSFSACKKDGSNQKLTADQFKNAGIEHNKNLGLFLQALSKVKTENRLMLVKERLAKNNINFDLKAYTNNSSGLKGRLTMLHDDSNNQNVSPVDVIEGETKQYVIDSQLDQYLTDGLINYTTQVFDGVPLYDDEHLYTAANAAQYTNSAKSVLDELNVVVTDDDTDLASCIHRIHVIESEIATLNLSEQELAQLYTTTNTAINSLTYWHDNGQDWVNVLSNRTLGNNVPSVEVLRGGPKASSLMLAANGPKPGFSWKKVGKGDIAGAAAGVAAFGAGAALGGPVTWGAFGASVGGWAAGCSAYEAIMQLL